MTQQSDEMRRGAWSRAAEMDGFTTHDLMDATGRSMDWCRGVIRAWRADGLVVEQGRAQNGQKRYCALPDAEPGESTFGRERRTPEFAMWRTMRDLRRFTAEDVHLRADVEERRIALRDVQQYCSVLAEAGVIDCVRQKRFGRASARYAIKGRPGPFPPRLMRVPAIYDPNSEEFQVLRKRVRL